MKTQEQKHYENCSAPICVCDTNKAYKDEVVWYPGEPICKWKPYTKIQENQIIINDLFRKGKIEDGVFSANQLEKIVFSKLGKIIIK